MIQPGCIDGGYWDPREREK